MLVLKCFDVKFHEEIRFILLKVFNKMNLSTFLRSILLPCALFVDVELIKLALGAGSSKRKKK